MKEKTIIIAEAGVNHNGCMETARKLIDVAATAGCDFVKFQTFKADKLASPRAEKAEYQKANDSRHDSQIEMLKALELKEEDHHMLIEYCQEKGIKFLSTPFDEDSADFLEQHVELFKIPSGEITNFPFIEHVSQKGLPIVMSTGMASMEEILEATRLIKDIWETHQIQNVSLTVLHCTTSYPTPMSEVNLQAMDVLEEELEADIGYSDHTLGITVPIAAVARGAKLIEKHFTLDRSMEGPDHQASLEPDELKQMVERIRNVEECLGKREKSPTPSEIKNKKIARKSLYLKDNLKAGEVVERSHFLVTRPEGSIHPRHLKALIGKTLTRDIEAFEDLSLNDFRE